MPLECSECYRIFSIKSNLTRHLRMIHNIETERIDLLPGDFEAFHFKCLEGCKISFKYNRELRKHLRTQHNIDLIELNLDFPNSEEFEKWLHHEEASNYVQYVHLTATKRKSTGTETYYYECSRTGKRSGVKDEERKRRVRKHVTKVNRGCTSQIIANRFHDGSYSINYFKTHYGHDIKLEHLKLSKQERGTVASRLLLGLPVSKVLHSAKKTKGESLNRLNLLEKKDVLNIGKAFNIDLKDGKPAKIDSINLNLFFAECESHENNPIIYSNINDTAQSEEIRVIIMSKYQAEILKEAGNNIVVITSVSLRHCDFELITIFVITKTWETFPGACMFTNKADSNSYNIFFEKIKSKIDRITPQILFTNCEEMYYDAWKSAMGEITHCFYNPTQIEVDLKLNLNRIVCNEPEVTKLKRKWAADSIKSLQSNDEEYEFLESFEATLDILKNDVDFADFLKYFLKNYDDPSKWVDSYKIGLNVPTKQLSVISDVLRHYLNEEIENRFDKIFHSLIRFIRDETVNSMLNSKNNRIFFINENDARHRLLENVNFNGVDLGENVWKVGDDSATTYIVQKFLDKKCCSLICTKCCICLHCFSCSCVDFFIGNAICVHIHYIWVTYCQSILQKGDESGNEADCDEEIVIEINQNLDEAKEIEHLQKSITERSDILCSNVAKIANQSTLKVILDTLCQLCDVSTASEVTTDDVTVEKVTVNEQDHSYL